MFIVCVLVGRVFCFQAEDGIRDLVRSRGLGDVYKRQERRVGLVLHDDRQLELVAEVEKARRRGAHHQRQALSLIHI